VWCGVLCGFSCVWCHIWMGVQGLCVLCLAALFSQLSRFFALIFQPLAVYVVSANGTKWPEV